MKSPWMPQGPSPTFGHQKNSAWQHCSGGGGSNRISKGSGVSAFVNQSNVKDW